MSNPELIFRFLTDRIPAPFCDDCIAAQTGVSPRQQVHPIATAFGLTTDFSRVKGVCSLCKNDKLVTKALRYT
jgi:hypothetical protein